MGVPTTPPTPANSAHTDGNQQFSVIGVSGTLGTADLAGTAPTVPFSADPTTGAQYVYNLAPAGAQSNPSGGTLNTLGTVGTILGIGGTVQVAGASAGTNVNIVTGTQQTLGTVGTIPGIGIVTRIGNIGTIESGTVTTTLALNTGTITTIAAGTQNTLGTVGVLNTGTLAALASGTITAGTVVNNGGTVANLATGTINALAAGTITTGTVQVSAGTVVGTFLEVLGSATAGTTDLVASMDVSNYKWVSLQLTNTWVGTINTQVSNDNVNFVNLVLTNETSVATGLSGNLTNNNLYHGPLQFRYLRVRMNAFTSGTAQAFLELYSNPSAVHTMGVSAAQSGAWNVTGTVATGTVQVTAGTLSPLPTIANSTFGTHGTTGVSVFGTLAGGTSSGAGTEIFVTSLSLSMPATAGSQDISIGFGTNAGTFHAGTGLLLRGMFPAGGGIQKEFVPAINSGTNGQLCYFQAGAGTAEINVTYFVTASTL